jgi:hypothetical protein
VPTACEPLGTCISRSCATPVSNYERSRQGVTRTSLTERFTKAVEQLGRFGPENLAVRIGGIYALEQIALDSEELHWPIVEVLTAFVRTARAEEESPISAPWIPASALKDRDRTPIRADLQVIATVLGRRPGSRRRWEREHQGSALPPFR